jgi:hypothetical protein
MLSCLPQTNFSTTTTLSITMLVLQSRLAIKVALLQEVKERKEQRKLKENTGSLQLRRRQRQDQVPIKKPA